MERPVTLLLGRLLDLVQRVADLYRTGPIRDSEASWRQSCDETGAKQFVIRRSAVNLDEEAGQSDQVRAITTNASAQVIQIARSVFELCHQNSISLKQVDGPLRISDVRRSTSAAMACRDNYSKVAHAGQVQASGKRILSPATTRWPVFCFAATGSAGQQAAQYEANLTAATNSLSSGEADHQCVITNCKRVPRNFALEGGNGSRTIGRPTKR